jgi:DNA-binding response OmpR family regulator
MGSGKAVTRETLAGLHILLVEDDPPTSELFKMIFEYAGALVSVAGSAEHALRLLDRLIPDVVVSDIAMPQRDGVWLIGQVRKRDAEQGGTVPAIAVTAGDYRHDRVLAAGFDVCFRKPADPEMLCEAIAAVVQKGSRWPSCQPKAVADG